MFLRIQRVVFFIGLSLMLLGMIACRSSLAPKTPIDLQQVKEAFEKSRSDQGAPWVQSFERSVNQIYLGKDVVAVDSRFPHSGKFRLRGYIERNQIIGYQSREDRLLFRIIQHGYKRKSKEFRYRVEDGRGWSYFAGLLPLLMMRGKRRGLRNRKDREGSDGLSPMDFLELPSGGNQKGSNRFGQKKPYRTWGQRVNALKQERIVFRKTSAFQRIRARHSSFSRKAQFSLSRRRSHRKYRRGKLAKVKIKQYKYQPKKSSFRRRRKYRKKYRFRPRIRIRVRW